LAGAAADDLLSDCVGWHNILLVTATIFVLDSLFTASSTTAAWFVVVKETVLRLEKIGLETELTVCRDVLKLTSSQ
jgi:hypothetical protein